MVKIINYRKFTKDDGTIFCTLEIQGGVEILKSKTTGKMYATVRSTSIPTTFDEMTCQALLGQELEGAIEKKECEPYEYTVKETGEVIMLTHTYEYCKEETPKQEYMMQPILSDNHQFSVNERLEEQTI